MTQWPHLTTEQRQFVFEMHDTTLHTFSVKSLKKKCLKKARYQSAHKNVSKRHNITLLTPTTLLPQHHPWPMTLFLYLKENDDRHIS